MLLMNYLTQTNLMMTMSKLKETIKVIRNYGHGDTTI